MKPLRTHFLEEKCKYYEQEFLYSNVQNLFAVSDYAAQYVLLNPSVLFDQLKDKSIFKRVCHRQLKNELLAMISSETDESGLIRKLRMFRHKQMIKILFQEANDYTDIQQVMHDLSLVAECCIDVSLQWLSNAMHNEFGIPFHEDSFQQMVVLGLGKLGGMELNFSSDVDLIFCYPKSGITKGGNRTVENQWFFNRLGQSLISTLDKVTSEGFVFRVDLRLRPYGNSGALTLSFDAMEQYYQDQGRDWERYALIKARPVAGNKEQGYELLNMLKPFIYRRYLDFSAVEALRDMKALIRREIKQKGMQNNIKTGPGGIREIEFVAQTFQLVYGGRKHQLQNVSLLKTLNNLQDLSLLSKQEVDKLRASYLFLRHFEHLIQAWSDKQTHDIPEQEHLHLVLAKGMGYASWSALFAKLKSIRLQIDKLFSSLMSEPEAQTEGEGKWHLLWQNKADKALCIEKLQQHRFSEAEKVYQQLILLRDGYSIKNISGRALERINRFMPVLLHTCESFSSPSQSLLRTLPIISNVFRRTSYLLLLLEHPGALKNLVRLCSDSLWISLEIAKYPSLMDEFLNAGYLYNPPSYEALQDELFNQLAHITKDDIESKLQSLCYFKLSHFVKSVFSQINGHMSLVMISNYLTWVAECIVQAVSSIAWDMMTEQYGLPEGVDASDEKPFIILGYGKLGGIEMGPGSDLDLVFIHNTDPQGLTSGKRSIDHQTFFSRFGQKVIHFLSTLTPLGRLYEVDVRLRPSGNAGLLVSPIIAFESYQKEKAWVWEQQALIRARVVVGDNKLMTERFKSLRSCILKRASTICDLHSAVKKMRNKMKTLDKSDAEKFDIKYGRGGIIDIEFIVQYMVLCSANKLPSLLEHTDNITLLEILTKEQLLAASDKRLLKKTYLKLRAISHKKTLQKESDNVISKTFLFERQGVIKIWNSKLKDNLSVS